VRGFERDRRHGADGLERHFVYIERTGSFDGIQKIRQKQIVNWIASGRIEDRDVRRIEKHHSQKPSGRHRLDRTVEGKSGPSPYLPKTAVTARNPSLRLRASQKPRRIVRPNDDPSAIALRQSVRADRNALADFGKARIRQQPFSLIFSPDPYRAA